MFCLFGVNIDKFRSDILAFRLYGNVVEVNIPGVAYKETFGGQTSPHGGFRVVFFFFILDGLFYHRHIAGCYPPLCDGC